MWPINVFRRGSPVASRRQQSRRRFHPAVETLESRLVLMGLTGPPPTISSLGPNMAVEGGPTFTLTVNGSNFQHGAVVDWNGMDLPTTFVSSSKLTATVSASLLKEETGPEHGGPIAITVVEFNVPSNVVPFTIAEAPIVAHGGFRFTGPILNNVTLATFTDTGGPELPFPIDYVASVNWGDGVTDVGTITGPDASGVFTVTGSHAYANLNPTTITVTIIHESAPPVSVQDFVNGPGNPGGGPIVGMGGFVINGRELQPLNNVTVATFTTPGNSSSKASDFSATINWGDGTTSTGTITGPDANGVFTVTGSHTYAEDGEQESDLIDVFPITVTISQQGANPTTVTSTANIAEEAEVLNAQGGFVINGRELQPLNNVVLATFKGDNNEPASAFKVTINWGDGTTSTGKVTGPDANGVFTVTGSHTYAEDGEQETDLVDVFTITVTISNQNTATVTDTANIAEENEVISAQGGFIINGKELQPLNNVVVATFKGDGSDPASHFKATINWGDGTTSAGTITGPDANGVFTVTGTHTYAEDGEVESDLIDVFPITVTISNSNTMTVTSTANIAEEDEITSAQGGFVINGKELQPLNNVVVATFKGDGSDPASAFSATINWGDGTTSAGTITGPDANGVFTVTGSHTYAEDGEVESDLIDVFPITVTISMGAQSVTVTSTANIAEEDEITSPQGGFIINGKELQPLNNVVVATFTGDGNDSASDFHAMIDWGDGTTSVGIVTGPDQNGVFTVTGSHTYADEGDQESDAVDVFPITVTITNGMTVMVTSTANIAEEDAPPAPPGGAARAPEGPKQGSTAPAEALLLGSDPLLGTRLTQQWVGQDFRTDPSMAGSKAEWAVSLGTGSGFGKSRQAVLRDDTYWQLTDQQRGDRINDPNDWAVHQLALALDGTVPGRSRWWSAPS